METKKRGEDKGCMLCPRRCGAKREIGERGICGADAKMRISRAALHMWEEPCISGETGSGTVFFCGCPLHCVYCQNSEISGAEGGMHVTEAELAQIFLNLQKQGAANINLVTPTQYAEQIAQAVRLARQKGMQLPVVCNTSGYERTETLRMLEGIVDIYLTDFKYMDTESAKKYSHAADYPKIAGQALAEMVRQHPESRFDENGMMQEGVIVRHLVLPGHVKEARNVISYVYKTYGEQVWMSLMNQYTPFTRLKNQYPELCRRVTEREYERVIAYALDLGMEQAFIQEGETAEESFIPPFDLEGLEFLEKYRKLQSDDARDAVPDTVDGE